jgi:hypothetical protein
MGDVVGFEDRRLSVTFDNTTILYDNKRTNKSNNYRNQYDAQFNVHRGYEVLM